ncbi:TSUP family transporter [Streptomyces goshikiensis]|uniref:TSUP family transporter n=1 Tax=Streptomyces goshikiensis TaxID=1942 RepID=UPI0037169044
MLAQAVAGPKPTPWATRSTGTSPDATPLHVAARNPSESWLQDHLVAAIMGVAGGELLIPTIVLLFGVDIKIAGSLSLLVCLPTMLVAFARYSRDGSFAVLGANIRFTATMAAGSIVGAVLGGLLLGVFPDIVLIPLLVVILLVSAFKLARHA